MATAVIMPKVDMDQETGTVREWLKQDGDVVKAGETILEIETDKVAIDVEAPASGILAGITASVGETVPIATTIAYILSEGESLPAEAALAARQGPGHEAPPLPEAPAHSQTTAVASTPVARNLASEAGIDLAAVPGSGPRGKVTKKDVQQALADGSVAGPRPYATPAARRVATATGVDLTSISGSGPNGRIQEADVLAAQTLSATDAAPRPTLDATTVIQLAGMRRTIAERLTASYRQIPHIHFTLPIDMTSFDEARSQLNAHAEAIDQPRISATALLVKLVAATLARCPQLNSNLIGEEIHLFPQADIGVAVALDDGLIVPVVRDAGSKGIGQIAAEVRDLASRARSGDLAPAEVRGGTFTISNLGPFGIEAFTAIINPPQTAILAVGATQQEVVPDPAGHVVVRPIMRVTLGADHRVIDGAVAAQFLAALKEAVEQPLLLLY